MNKLFVYGTLHDPEVQLRIIGRTVPGMPDAVEGFRKSSVTIDGKVYPIAVPEKGMWLEGWVLEITDEELAKCDVYEGTEYRRLNVKLKSGVDAWAYQK